ncbi:MAG: single-stranded-DNA-specific exonuclease RecJ [bacterium]|nr:single-stranded-DNA-specific exonuclease RecJ [bacterium]
MNKIWKINKRAPKEFFDKFPEYLKITLQLLWDRELRNQKSIDEFFNPDYEQDLHDPFLLKDIKPVIKRINQAAVKKEKVVIFADYDADGICGGVILSEILKSVNIEQDIYIPDRNKEGYGLNFKAIEEIAKKGVKLILTIDCGITDFEEVKLANKLGMDVIIIDHHEIPKKLPPAVAIIDPKQKKDKYPFKDLAATGVAFKVLQAFFKTKKIPIKEEKWLLDLVAIATVTDSMLLLGENRTLVRYGLIVLSQTRRIGLRELMKIARVKPVFNPQTLETNLNTYTLGFILGPRLNAASRIDHGATAYKLLTAITEDNAREVSLKLEQKNQERQRTTERILKEARNRVLGYSSKRKIIFEGDETWIAGIVGLVAQKLTDEFCLPCFIYQKMKDYSIGSVRGVPGFNVVKALTKCKKFLIEFGGHYGAAGFRILNKNLKDFHQAMEKYSNRELKVEEITPYLHIDADIDINELNWVTFEQLEKLAPFGEGNPAPLFLLKEVKITEMKSVGSNGCHLKMSLEKEAENGMKRLKAIGFGLAGFCDKIKLGEKVDIVFEMIANEWNGTRELQLKIIDLKKS